MIITPKPFLWIAFPGVLGGYKKIIELAKSLGFGGIAPRAGLGGWNDPSLKAEDIRAILDAGLECGPWIFSKPEKIKQEASSFRALQDLGASYVIIDAEIPWDNDPEAKTHALEFGDLMGAMIHVPIYDAPWPAISWHPGYPEKEFRWVTGRMPQSYWTEIGWSAFKTLDTMHRQWANKDDRLLPIGITYGRKEIAKWGGQLPPGEISASDIDLVADEITGGWYSGEAAGPGILEAISQAMRPKHEPGPTQPETSSVPLGWADRAERDLEETLEALTEPEIQDFLDNLGRNRAYMSRYQELEKLDQGGSVG